MTAHLAEKIGISKKQAKSALGLEAEHYGAGERRRLYRTRIDALPRKLQAVAKQSEAMVLAELATPLEIQKFFDALPTLDPKKLRNPAEFVTEAISRAHQSSIERTVIDQIEERNDVRAAAVLWGLLKANDKLSLRLLRLIEEELGEGSQFEKGVSPLVTFFIAARNLRQADSTVTYYHPRVEAGIEQALRRDRIVAKRTLRMLVDVLLSPDGPGEPWGAAAAARLIAAADRVPELKPELSSSAQEKIDAWLASELMNDRKAFEANLALAAAAGSLDSEVSEVARFLLHRRDFWGMRQWSPPAHDETWYARMSAQPSVKQLLETFITEVLPMERDDFGQSFVAETERLAPGLTGAFLAAAAQAVNFGVTFTSEAIANGALNDLDAFESIVDAAVEVLTPTDANRQEAEITHLAIINGEYSEDYAEYLAGNDDDGYTAGEFLKAYVDRVRANRDWRRLALHRHRDRLLRYWFEALAKDPGVSSDEVVGVFANGRESGAEDYMWYALSKAWDPRFLDALVERILEGDPRLAVRTSALTCLIERACDEIPVICRRLEEHDRQARLVEIALELAEVRRKLSPFNGEEHGQAATAAASVLPSPLAEISEAAFALEAKKVAALSNAAHTLVEDVNDASEQLRVFRVTLDEHVTLDIADDVGWLLANTHDPGAAVEAIKAAIRHGMSEEVKAALSHKFADVVALALKAVATPLPVPLPGNLLFLAHAKGSPVRRALVELLDAKSHPDHLSALMQLVKDEWSSRAAYYGEEDDYPIAQAAVETIAKMGALPAETVEELYRVAIDTCDSDLRYKIFALLVGAAGGALQQRLFDLAVNPGRLKVRRAAANALLAGSDHVCRAPQPEQTFQHPALDPAMAGRYRRPSQPVYAWKKALAAALAPPVTSES